MAQVYTIEGNIGAGKTTLLNTLKQKYICYEEPVYKWSLLKDFYKDMVRFALPFQVQVLTTLYEQNKEISKLSKNNIVFIERSPWTAKNIFIELMKKDGIWLDSYDVVYSSLYPGDSQSFQTMFFIDLEPEECIKRIIKRNRFQEKDITVEYIRSLDSQYKIGLKNKNFNLVILDGKKTTEELYNDVENYLKKN